MVSRMLFRLSTATFLIATVTLLAADGFGVSANGDKDNEQDRDEAFDLPEKTGLKYANLGSHLNGLMVQVEGGEATSKHAASDTLVHSGESVSVTIYLSGNVDGVVSFLEGNAADLRNVGEDYIEAYVPVTLLGRLAGQPGVIRVREIIPPESTHGLITSQGVQAHGAPDWHQSGMTGQGVKVGIVDNGFEGFADLMGTELPTTVQARCYTEVGVFTANLVDCGNNSRHGTATAENLIDIAPNVSLYIATYGSKGDFRDTVDWMIAEGVSVINRSLGGDFEGPGDGTSPFTNSRLNTIDRAVEGGITFLNSAGNNAKEAWFQDSPPSIYDSDGDGYGFVEFAVGDPTNSIGWRTDGAPRLHKGHRIWAYLRWEDTWPGASTDLDLYIIDSTSGEVVARGEDNQSGRSGDVPTELLYTEIPRDGEYLIAVAYRGGDLPDWIQLRVPKAIALEHFTEGHSINGPSESANPGMLAVGATHYWDTHTIADYSSRGPTLDGRIKPDIVGAACGQTESYESHSRGGYLCWFAGTSSASPHVAGLAALVRQRFPDYTTQEVAQYLKDNAAQRETPDPNNTWGHGFAELPSSKEMERAALVTLYHSAGGPNWTNNANWLSDQPVGRWHGVTTNHNGRVVGLSLPDNQLTGAIPSELGDLTNLTRLDLSDNRLTGPIPAWMGALANLRELHLRGNQFTGMIPTELGNLENLEALFLSGNQFTGCIPVGIAGMAHNDLDQIGLPTCGVLGISSIATGAGFLTVTWTAPSVSEESAIIAYDLRYIQSDATDKSDAGWASVDNAWTTGSGPLSYQLSGLTTDTQYDLEVRAVTAAGDGPWSSTVTGTPTLPTGASATRSLSAVSVAPGGALTVTITATNYGVFGGVSEALPAGFSYVSSSLDDAQVRELDARTVRFILQGDTSFTYTAIASDVEGLHTFSGTLRDYERNDRPVVGHLTVTVTVPSRDPLIARYDANNNGTIEKSEGIKAINDYLFGVGDAAISKADVIKVVNLYLFG